MSEFNDQEAEYRSDGDPLPGEQKPVDDSAPWLEDASEAAEGDDPGEDDSGDDDHDHAPA